MVMVFIQLMDSTHSREDLFSFMQDKQSVLPISYICKSAINVCIALATSSEMRRQDTNYEPANRFQTYRSNGGINPNSKDWGAVDAARLIAWTTVGTRANFYRSSIGL